MLWIKSSKSFAQSCSASEPECSSAGSKSGTTCGTAANTFYAACEAPTVVTTTRVWAASAPSESSE